MSGPSRAQIEANYALPKYKVELLNPLGSWIVLDNARVTSLDGSVQSVSGFGNAFAFGAPSSPNATVVIDNYTVYTTYTFVDPIWIGQPMRISFGFDTSDYVVVFYGPITTIDQSKEQVTLTLSGIEYYISTLKLHTEIFHRKPIATKTTTTSVEDPTNIAYIGGMINYALWQAGGRPYEQQGINYTEASVNWRFWYSLDNSIVSPDFVWFSGDNTLDDLFMMARASGGQLYQDKNGVYKYSQPLSLASTANYTSFFTFTDSMFDGFQKTINTNETVGTVLLTFTERHVDPEQVIIDDKTPRFFNPNELQTITLQPQDPIWSYVGVDSYSLVTMMNCFTAVLLNGEAINPQVGQVWKYANKLVIEVKNQNTTFPMILSNIKIKGRPLKAGEESTTHFGTGMPERDTENNPYVQSNPHAERLARMIYDFYADNKPIIKLSNVMFDPDRFVGELVYINSATFSNDGNLYRIVAINYSGSGTSMEVTLVNVVGIPTSYTMFVIGNTYSDGDSRSLSY